VTRLVLIRRALRDRAGVTIIEFAILLPFFLILIFGIIEFAQVVFFQAALQHAVTNAARCYSEFAAPNALGSGNTPPDCSTIANVQAIAVQQAYGLNIPSATFTPAAPANGYNCVSARYVFNLTIPLMPPFPIPLTATSCYPVAPP
jgi:Flp pilus assembly protein TadG